MSDNKKLVNVYPRTPIFGLGVPLVSTCMGVRLTLGDIKVAIGRGANVDEIVGKNKVVRLDFKNYDKDNSGNTIEKEEVKPEVKVEDKKIDTSNVKNVEVHQTIPGSKTTTNNVPPAKPFIPEAKTVVDTANTAAKAEPIGVKTVNQVDTSTLAKAKEKINNLKK